MMLGDAIDGAGTYMAFSLIVLSFYGIGLIILLFCLLAIRAAWRWLMFHTWGDVILSAQRKALR